MADVPITITEAAEWLRSGRITSVALTETLLARSHATQDTIAAFITITDEPALLLALPVVINVILLLSFAETLRAGQVPMIERFARLSDPHLTDEKRAHCRRWTQRWCAFFVVNGVIAALLGALATPFVWASYTGGVAYALRARKITLSVRLRSP